MKTDNLDISRVLKTTDLASNIDGYTINCEQMVIASFNIICTGAPSGKFQVQYSNDIVQIVNGAQTIVTNWTTDASLDTAVAAAGSYLIKIPDIAFRFVKLIYTKTSGTGAVTVANYIAKGV